MNVESWPILTHFVTSNAVTVSVVICMGPNDAIRSSRIVACLSSLSSGIPSNAMGMTGGPSPRLRFLLGRWTSRRCSDPTQLIRVAIGDL